MKENPNHIYNNIKQCNYCGLVWVKVSECPETKCGAFPPFDDPEF